MDSDQKLPFSPEGIIDAISPFQPFPTEILIAIFDFACTDAGQTARTLCLVSASVRAIVKPLLFRSISACGIDQMLKVADRLENDPRIYPAVRHLFLSEHNPMLLHEKDHVIFKSEEQSMLLNAASRIITLLAPFLETLSYIFPNSRREVAVFRPLFPAPLPRLRELAIHGHSNEMQFTTSFPSLERLHLYAQYPYSLVCDLDQKCPRLTHLKLTGLTYDGENIEIGLKRAQGTLTERWEMEKAERVVPLCLPPLRRLTLQPALMSGRACGTGRHRLRNLWERLREFGREELGYALVIEEPSPSWGYCKRAKEDWVDRLDGGEGCWKIREEVE